MINYAGLGRILFPNNEHQDNKIHRYNKENKARYQAENCKKTPIRIKTNIWSLARRDQTNLKFFKIHFTQQHADYIKLNNSHEISK